MLIRLTFFLLLLVPAVSSAQTTIKLDDRNLQQWRDHILPAADDLTWQKIPWLTTFADGILSADQLDKPLLLWVMNGHPLGCT